MRWIYRLCHKVTPVTFQSKRITFDASNAFGKGSSVQWWYFFRPQWLNKCLMKTNAKYKTTQTTKKFTILNCANMQLPMNNVSYFYWLFAWGELILFTKGTIYRHAIQLYSSVLPACIILITLSTGNTLCNSDPLWGSAITRLRFARCDVGENVQCTIVVRPYDAQAYSDVITIQNRIVTHINLSWHGGLPVEVHLGIIWRNVALYKQEPHESSPMDR